MADDEALSHEQKKPKLIFWAAAPKIIRSRIEGHEQAYEFTAAGFRGYVPTVFAKLLIRNWKISASALLCHIEW